MLAELLDAVGAVRAVAGRELAGIAALRIVRAADEAAELAELERQPAGLAIRTLARVAAVLARRKQVRRQHLVERVDHLGDPQLLDVADGGGELAPEVAQQVAPGDLVVGDAVELLFEVRGEAVFDVAGEEALEEGGEHASLVLGDEAALVDANIAVIRERL